MSPESATITAAIIAIIGAILSSIFVPRLARMLVAAEKREQARQPGSAERLQQLIRTLDRTAREASVLIQEIETDLQSRLQTLAGLQHRNAELTAEEEMLNRRLEALRSTKVEVAEYFEQSMETMERQGARRDLLLFGAGAVTTAIISILLKHFGLA